MTKAQEMLAFAREQLGEPYDLGDHGPDRVSRLTEEQYTELTGRL